MTLLVGRQPIFDREQKTIGYELLFRSPQQSGPLDDTAATAQVINNALMNEPLDQLVGDKKAFINFPADFFSQPEFIEPPFGPDQLVIEILETVPVSETILRNLAQLKSQGYTLALDDFIFKKEFVPFLKLADIIKLEVHNRPADKLKQVHDKIRSITQAQLLAEKVETHQVHQLCIDIGFDYFQGYFYAKPEVIETRKVTVSQQALLRLLAQINRPDVHLDELEEIVRTDPGLTVKLLNLAKSFPSQGEFHSISAVMQFYGLVRIKNWISMLSMASLEHAHEDVILQAMIRAHFFEQVAKLKMQPDADNYYLIGLISNLEALMQLPLKTALQDLPIHETLKKGLLNRSGLIGQLMNWSEALESQQGEQVPEAIRALYFDAVSEATRAFSAIMRSG